jgi:hypothetical protein
MLVMYRIVLVEHIWAEGTQESHIWFWTMTIHFRASYCMHFFAVCFKILASLQWQHTHVSWYSVQVCLHPRCGTGITTNLLSDEEIVHYYLTFHNWAVLIVIPIQHHGKVVSIPASFSGGREFEFWPGDHLSWLRFWWFSTVAPGSQIVP